MDEIYSLLRAAVRGPLSTKNDKQKLLKAIDKLKSKQDLKTLDDYIKNNDDYFSMPFIEEKRLSLQDILRDELKGEDLSLSRQIMNKLKSLGVNMKCRKLKETETLLPNTIEINTGGVSGSW
jgi:hypothetical protein